MANPGDTTISVGNRALSALFVGWNALVALGIGVLLIQLVRSAAVPVAFRVLFAILAAIVLVGVLALALVLARNPRVLSRTIVITPTAVLLPARRFGPIPIEEIAGVGLALQRNPRGGLPGGNWVLAVWRLDASLAYAGGLQRRAELDDPTRSRVAAAARQLHTLVEDRQGPDGALALRQLQRHATFGPFEQFTAVWDPAPPV